jgi:hypothetical protein
VHALATMLEAIGFGDVGFDLAPCLIECSTGGSEIGGSAAGADALCDAGKKKRKAAN